MSDDLVKRLREAFVDLDDLNDAADRIEELESKLAKAVEGFNCWRSMMNNPAYDMGEMVSEFDAIVCTTIAELTGGKDE